MKITRRQLRKIINEEANSINELVPLAIAAHTLPVALTAAAKSKILGAIVAAGLAVSTVDADDFFKKLDPEVREKIIKAYDSILESLDWLGEDAMEDALAAVINKILG